MRDILCNTASGGNRYASMLCCAFCGWLARVCLDVRLNKNMFRHSQYEREYMAAIVFAKLCNDARPIEDAVR